MKFINECSCIVDYSILEKAIIDELPPHTRDFSRVRLHKNKLNNNINNLQVMKSELHTKEHNIVQYVSKKYMKGYGNRMKNIVSRNDVTEEKVKELRSNGFTISEIAKELKCGINTVNRRLGMKDY